MNTIIIPVGKDNPEDNYLDLVKILKEQFPQAALTVTDALVVETDNPVIANLFRAINSNGPKKINGSNGKGDICPDCGKPVSKPGRRCKSCTMRLRRKSEPESELAEVVDEPAF